MTKQSGKLLPVVQEGVAYALAAEMRERDIVAEMGHRLTEEQPEIARVIGSYILNRTNDPAAQQQLFEVAMLTYHMLEAQAEADHLNEGFGDQSGSRT